MKFVADIPEKQSVGELNHFEQFLLKGQPELCDFLKQFLGLKEVRIQSHDIMGIKKWLQTDELKQVNFVPNKENEICLVSQIYVDNRLIAYYPYVLVGRFVKKYALAKSLYTRMTEAISDQLTACYMQGFYGGDWLFGDKFAQMVVANCVSSNLYDGVKFAHLIERMEQLSVSTFEGNSFTTGVIVTNNSKPYKQKSLTFKDVFDIDHCEKREWFLADGKSSFFIIDSHTYIRYLYSVEKKCSSDFIADYFENYYLGDGKMVEPDFIVRTVGANELSVSDATGKEFVRIENVWRYRYKKNLIDFMSEVSNISEELSNAILYYILKCSRLHVSTIIWVPKICDSSSIESVTTNNRIKIWKQNLNVLKRSDEVIIDKVLASDGAVVINNENGDIIYESVFADLGKAIMTSTRLAGTGETATSLLAQNGLAVKVSQDGAIKIYAGDEKLCY